MDGTVEGGIEERRYRGRDEGRVGERGTERGRWKDGGSIERYMDGHSERDKLMVRGSYGWMNRRVEIL
jgi:hypothetical protein